MKHAVMPLFTAEQWDGTADEALRLGIPELHKDASYHGRHWPMPDDWIPHH